MTNKACIALFVGHTTSNWGTYLFLTNIPTYMKEVLKFDIKSVILYILNQLKFNQKIILNNRMEHYQHYRILFFGQLSLYLESLQTKFLQLNQELTHLIQKLKKNWQIREKMFEEFSME